MQICKEAEKKVLSHQKSGSYAMLVDFRSRYLSVIILRSFLSEPKICQPDLLKKVIITIKTRK